MNDEKISLPIKIITTLTYIFLIAPLAIIIIASFSPTAVLSFPPKSLSFKWYFNILGPSMKFIDGLINSLSIASIATLIDIFLAVLAALAVTRYEFKGKNALINFFTSPMFIPPITFAFVLLQIFSIFTGLSSFTKILLGHIVIILPYIMRNTISILSIYDLTLEKAAYSLGANPFECFFKVTLPVIKPGIIAGALLSFLYSFDEAVISGFLTSAKFVTLPIRIMNYIEFSFDPTLAAISTLLIIMSLIVIVVVDKIIGLSMFIK